MDYSIKIGGEAGQGIVTIGETLAKVFSRSGYHVFTHQDYESRVRGGHNFYQIRISDLPVMASRDRIDILVAFDKAGIQLHEKEMTGSGMVIYDSSALKETHDKPNFLDIPFASLALERGGNKIMANTVAIGAVLGILGAEMETLYEIIKDTFRKKGVDVVNGNINSAIAGMEYATKKCAKCSFSLPSPSKPKPPTVSGSPRKICGCAAKATCSVSGRAACLATGSHAPTSTPSSSRKRATKRCAS